MRQLRRNNNTPCPFKVGDRILPIDKFEHHDYRRGESYVVVEIDGGDSTLKARDEHGQTGRWIRWRDCEKFNDIGWEWLKGQLSVEALELLSAFDGLQTLRLRPEIRIALVERLPALKEKVIDACVAPESRTPTPEA
jgi:hypothetical protein